MAKSVPSAWAREQAAKRILKAKAVKRRKGLLYRAVKDINDKASLAHLKDESTKLGLHVIRIDQFYVILCGKPEIEVIC